MADATVRPATPDDVDEIARVQLLTWETTDILPPDVLAGLSVSSVADQWRQTISQGPATVWVATEGPWTVGFCSAGASPESESAAADGTPAEDAATVGLIATLLVEPRWGRRGHGGRLLARAGTGLREAGSTRGIAWVPERNAPMLRFYERAGWTTDGVIRTLDAGGHPLRERRYTGSLEFALRD